MNYPAALPHDPPQQIAEDLFVVHGSVKVLPIARMSRNMAIVRYQGELTLINPVRMDEAGLAGLEALGTVRHVLRLGAMHGMDDRFYVDRYQADFWSFAGGTLHETPTIDHVLVDGGELPFTDATLFAFDHISQPEGAILLQRSKAILLTCDAVQSYSTAPHMPYTGWLLRLVSPLMGFPRKTLIGPIWVKLLVQDRAGIEAEFERLLRLDFEQLLSAHGTFLAANAHAEVESAYQKIFGK